MSVTSSNILDDLGHNQITDRNSVKIKDSHFRPPSLEAQMLEPEIETVEKRQRSCTMQFLSESNDSTFLELEFNQGQGDSFHLQ
jgi:hypothetical protein